jgi:hypothetical protein
MIQNHLPCNLMESLIAEPDRTAEKDRSIVSSAWEDDDNTHFGELHLCATPGDSLHQSGAFNR